MSNTEFPLVSIIITTYKRADLLDRALESVLNQSYKNIEIVIVDDNDPNTEFRSLTEKKMEKYSSDERVNYIKHSKNKNGAAARNTGLKFSNGDYVTYLDDDDTYRIDKVLKQTSFLLNNPQYNAVYCGWNKDGKEEAPQTAGDISFEILSGELLIRTNTIMMNREIALSVGGWDEKYRRNQEAVYLLRYFKAGHLIGSVNEVLVDYDSQDRSNASDAKQNEEDFVSFLEGHKELIEEAAKKTNRSPDTVYALRYISIFLRYLKYKDVKNALRIYLGRMKTMPLRFNYYLIRYVKGKLKE